MRPIPYGPLLLPDVNPPLYSTDICKKSWGVYRSVNPPRGVYTSKICKPPAVGLQRGGYSGQHCWSIRYFLKLYCRFITENSVFSCSKNCDMWGFPEWGRSKLPISTQAVRYVIKGQTAHFRMSFKIGPQLSQRKREMPRSCFSRVI